MAIHTCSRAPREHLVIADWEKPEHWLGDTVALDPENRLFTRISRAMTALLRFRAFRERLPIDRGGWMRVADVAKLVANHHVGEKLIMRVVRDNPTTRFQCALRVRSETVVAPRGGFA